MFLTTGMHPRNDTFCVGSTVLLSCTVYDNTTNNAASSTVWFKEDNPPVVISSNMINNTRNGDVVSSVLTIDNVSLSTEYFCLPTIGIRSYIGTVLVTGMCTYVHIGMTISNFVCTYICINVGS